MGEGRRVVSLFDPPPKRRRYRPSEPHELLPVDPLTCPACGTATVDHVSHADALIRHGGYGATLRTVYRMCPSCSWSLVVDVSEERPPS